MKLITETVEDIKILSEEKEDGGKSFFIEGIIMQGDIKNRNGRIYPKDTLIREMNRYNSEYVTKNRAFGELGHPQGPTINLDRVSHMFTELKEDGSNVVGKAKIMDTPMGKIVQSLIESDAQLGISSRGMGSLKKSKEGIMEVQNDFMLATAGDIVADPSAPNAFVNGIMEGVEYAYDILNGWVPIQETKVEEIEEQIEDVKAIARRSVKELEERAPELLKRFLNTL